MTSQTREALQEQASEILKQLWEEMCDGGPTNVTHWSDGWPNGRKTFAECLAHTDGAIFAYQKIGVINAIEAEAWRRRVRDCPNEGHPDEPRSWCAYCGDLPQFCDEAGKRMDDCPFCNNEDCRLCFMPLPPGQTCDHDVLERHEQPDRKFKDIRDYPRAYVTQKEFDELPEYSATVPTGVTINKRWKRYTKRATPDVDGKEIFTDEWLLGYYAERRDGFPGYLECFRIIQIVSKDDL